MRTTPPKQVRSARTLEKILEGCDRLLAERSFDRITMQDVAREAGVSVGNLYNRFEDRDALVAHAVERHQRHFIDRFTARLTDTLSPPALADRLHVLAAILQEEIRGLRPVFAMLASRELPSIQHVAGSHAKTDLAVETAVDWLIQGIHERPESADIRDAYRFAVASMAMQLQFDLLFGTATRLFGDRLIALLASQAYEHLTRDG